MSSRAFGSDASRQPSGILTPSSGTRLNNDTAATTTTTTIITSDITTNLNSSQGSKPMHHASAMQDLLKNPIVIKPHPPNLSVKPRSLQPLMLLPREHLQLSFLDLSCPFGTFQFSRSFESNIKILDLEGRMGSRSVVLIARLESDKTVYGIECQKDGLYTLCQLGAWVDLESLCGLATVSSAQLVRKHRNVAGDSVTAQPLTTPQLHQEHKKRRLAIEAIQSLVKKPTRSRSISTPSQAFQVPQLPTPIQDNVESPSAGSAAMQDVPPSQGHAPLLESQAIETPEVDAVPTANDIFDSIRNQYFEALYHSMGSLAYFAKGPLSRARATFHLDCDSTLEMNDLIDFLKSIVMTTVQIDKKYRETIPDIVSKMKTLFQDSDVEQAGARSKKRKAKKMKLGKDGLYPIEDEHVRKWWAIHKPQQKKEETITAADPQDTKLQISCLRSRETQLQMIIILEILALEPLMTSADGADSQLPGLPLVEKTTEASKQPVKKRNKHNLPFLLDVHADRLCIWHSTALDEFKLSEDSQSNIRPETQKSLRATSDPLKDFCVDIIVPFFSARLPERCDSINRKLGGPVMASPPKSKLKKPDTVLKSKAKPGAATKRPAPPKPSKALERVLSKETERHRRSISRGPSGVIALMRSASTPTLKREASEPLSVMSIPKADSTTSQEKSLQACGSGSSKRKPEEDKAKKDARVKAELQEAITALRRPNRDVVGKAMAEAAERRATTSLSQLRKSRKPTQHTRPHDVVKATPVGPRYRDALAIGHDHQPTRLRNTESTGTGQVPSSSLMIPASTPRKRNHEAAFTSDESPVLPTFRGSAHQVDATPARPSTLSRNFLSVPGPDESVVLASSPVMSWKSLQMKSLAAPKATLGHRDSGIGMPSSPSGSLAETPMKSPYGVGSLEGFVTVTPAKKRVVDKEKEVAVGSEKANSNGNEAGKKMSMSIFDRLGWNDDYDELC